MTADDPVRLYEIHRIMASKGFSKSETNEYLGEMVRQGYVEVLGENSDHRMRAYGINVKQRSEGNILYSSDELQSKLLAKYGSLEAAARAPWSLRADEPREDRIWE